MTSNIDVVIQPSAQKDIREILQYTFDMWGSGQRDTYRQVLERAFERMWAFPDIGQPAAGRPSTIREYHIEHHVIQYRRESHAVVILRIVSPRRQRRS